MKIENFALDLQSKSTKSSSTTVTSFVSELDTQNSKRLENIEAVNEELEFTKRLKFEMIQQLLGSLDSRKSQLKSLRNEEFHTKELSRRSISVHKEYHESQSLDVSMSGFIKTATQKVEIKMDISMSYSFVSEHEILAQQFHDPLVLNFNGILPELESKNFSFDIDNDGKSDQISMLKKGNGFLALDKNRNNKIDEGSELFGTLNGNGFSDLKRYDSDNNSWLDENDPIFDSLRIWIKNKDEDKLLALGEVGVGALYLGNTKDTFNIKSQAGETLGRIKSTGLFLDEDGTSGFMSNLDFSLQSKEANINMGLNNLLKIV